ncbi:response regulator transcription factor [Paraburkholderia diazotrophica]|uniref:response regulator transcription factor n=1 Tax=Paraburkholderia diazotrophica TaxID=667676 RepID=UPI003170D6E3
MHIAILQSDATLAKHLEISLVDAGHTCTRQEDGLCMLRMLSRSSVDLLVLDWRVGRLSGADLLRNIRATGGTRLPVVFASQDNSDESAMRALTLGADDYIGLPVNLSLFRLRVDALLRRSYPQPAEDAEYQLGPYRFSRNRLTVSFQGERVILSDTQFRLAELLFSNIGRLLSRDHIFASIWGREFVEATRTIDSHISRIRSLLKIDGRSGFEIQSVYKIGYRLTDLRAANADVVVR